MKSFTFPIQLSACLFALVSIAQSIKAQEIDDTYGMPGCCLHFKVSPKSVKTSGLRATYRTLSPQVIRSTRSEPVKFEIKVEGEPDRVVFEYDAHSRSGGTNFEMRDDGTGADRVAGDGVYSLELEARMITALNTPEWVFRPFIGFVALFQNGVRQKRYNIFAEVITDDIPVLPITVASANVQHNSHIVNIHDPEFFSDFDYARITNHFYQFFPDDYDFLAIIYSVSHFQNRHYRRVKNDVLGIGLELFDNSGRYGSTGRLNGLLVFPIPSLFDGVGIGFQHEIGHRWINFLRFPPLESGIPHWPLSSLASGIMGWSDPVTRQGFQFPCQLVSESSGIRLVRRQGSEVFTDFDLYLMGLLSPEEVEDQIVFVAQGLEGFNSILNQCDGRIFEGETTKVTIDDVIAGAGQRVPDSNASPHHFRIATIIVSRDGLLDQDALSFYGYFAKRATEKQPVQFASGFARGIVQPFALSTRGLGSVETAIVSKAMAMSDFNGDGTVNFPDFLLFVDQFGFSRSDEGYDARFDLDGDGRIGFGDFLIFVDSFGKKVSS